MHREAAMRTRHFCTFALAAAEHRWGLYPVVDHSQVRRQFWFEADRAAWKHGDPLPICRPSRCISPTRFDYWPSGDHS